MLNLLRLFVLHPHVGLTYSKEIVEEKRAEDGQTQSKITPHQPVLQHSSLHWMCHSPDAAVCVSCVFPVDVVSRLLNLLSSTDKPVTAMLVIRVLCNFFSRHVLSKAMGARYESIFDALATALQRFPPDENLRASAIALYINYTLLFSENNSLYEAGKVQLLSSLPEQLRLSGLSGKLVYRLLVVLGTLVYEDATVVEMAQAIEVPAVVVEVGKEHQQDAQVRDIVKELEQALSVKK